MGARFDADTDRATVFQNQCWESLLRYVPRMKQPANGAVRDSSGGTLGLSDDGDIRIDTTIECKWRRLNFTCAADFPYPTMIVDEMGHLRNELIPAADYELMSLERKKLGIKPFVRYLIGSADALTIAVVRRSSVPHWILESITDPIRKTTKPNWLCPVEHIQFISAAEMWRILEE